MVQGTMSGVGKSLISAGLCRVFKEDGYRVAPFKSQNMALNSYITEDGFEMGRAQVMQAEAAKIKPDVRMNPILLKPTSDMGSQVIVNGKAIGNMKAREYFEYKKSLIPEILKAYNSLSSEYDIIVIEGAGSPAEINLKDNDIVNMGMAALADAPVLLVGDIDRGGVFAQLLGTIDLLEDDERKRVHGLVINKFRGDLSILKSGIEMLEKKSVIDIVGVLPYTKLIIDDEDSQTERFLDKERALINIAVIALPRISNISDFLCFEQIEGVSVNYIKSPDKLKDMDMLIIPGSKNTIGDLRWLRESGMEAAIKKLSQYIPVFGICGGYQMLGLRIDDKDMLEEGGSINGMGLLSGITTLKEDKVTTRALGKFGKIEGFFDLLSDKEIEGYEIHMGETVRGSEAKSLLSFKTLMEDKEVCDGEYSGNVYGSYIHGIFDKGDIAYSIVKKLAQKKGVELLSSNATSYKEYKESQYDKLAEMIRRNMDMDKIYKILGIESND